MLLHGLAHRLIVFQEGGARVFEGGYQRFLEDRGWDEEKVSAAEEADEGAGGGGRKVDRKELRKLRAEIAREKGVALKPLEKRIAELEDAIVGAETELERLYENVESASNAGDGDAIADLSQKIHSRRNEIESCFKLLESVNLKYEKRKAPFDLRMKELEED
jgi:ATP-binding cassette subfamily F protein 3